MELNILSKEEKPLLSRTEITADLVFDAATPSKEQIKKQLAPMLKVDSNLIVVKKVYDTFGKKKAKVLAFAYKTEKKMKTIEPKPKKKSAKKEGKKEAPAEAPTEEKKETPKEEKKPKEEKPKETPKEAKEEPKKEEGK